MPKFCLRNALEKPEDMSASMGIALAESPEALHRACSHSASGRYDLRRHMFLRQAYVTLYVTAEKIIDGHNHYMQGGGHTEHTVFLSEVIHGKSFLAPIPKGTDTSSRKGKKKLKQSDRTKKMLGAPGKNDPPPLVKPKAEGLVPDCWDVEAFLPGMQKDKDSLPVMSCVGAAEADSCMASTRAGGRCTRKKVNGNFCHQHELELSSKQKQLEFVQDFEDILEATQEQWSQEQLNMAVALSLPENEEAREQKRRSDRLVAQRLSEMGLRKVETLRWRGVQACLWIATCFVKRWSLT